MLTNPPNLASVDLTDPAIPARFNAGVFNVGQKITPITFTNSGGSVQADGCTVAANTPTPPPELRVQSVLSDTTITCQITGTPTTIVDATTYTITASNTVGADTTPATVRFAIAVNSPLLSDITDQQTFTEETAIEPVIFTNTGLDVRANGCTASPTLPSGLSLEVYNDSGIMTCRIVGTPQAPSNRQTYSIFATSSVCALCQCSVATLASRTSSRAHLCLAPTPDVCV